MANLHVQPKRKNYLWIWILVIIVIIAAAIYYYMNYYNKNITSSSGNTFRHTPALQLKIAKTLPTTTHVFTV